MQRVTVFQHQGNGEEKIAGIRAHGRGVSIHRVIDLPGPLPDFIDDPGEYINADDVGGDLVLCFIKHPDIASHLAALCVEKGVPMIASGTRTKGAHCPFTCCGLGRVEGLGAYGEQFGVPELDVELENGVITRITVRRGASCGATWAAVEKIIGLDVETALPELAREVQYLCVADPSAFDPVTGKSSLHHAGHVHIAALKKAASKR